MRAQRQLCALRNIPWGACTCFSLCIPQPAVSSWCLVSGGSLALRQPGIQIPALPLTICVTLDKVVFSSLINGDGDYNAVSRCIAKVRMQMWTQCHANLPSRY